MDNLLIITTIITIAGIIIIAYFFQYIFNMNFKQVLPIYLAFLFMLVACYIVHYLNLYFGIS